jgi:hypothetical protein
MRRPADKVLRAVHTLSQLGEPVSDPSPSSVKPPCAPMTQGPPPCPGTLPSNLSHDGRHTEPLIP